MTRATEVKWQWPQPLWLVIFGGMFFVGTPIHA
jgi:hypothetical protein